MLQNMIRGMIAHEYGDLITQVLVNHLDDFAVEQLYCAVHGISPKITAHVGQQCLISAKKVCGWKYDLKDQTDNIIQGQFVSCTILEIDPYRRYPIKIEYQLYDNNAELVTEVTTCTEEELIIEKYD